MRLRALCSVLLAIAVAAACGDTPDDAPGGGDSSDPALPPSDASAPRDAPDEGGPIHADGAASDARADADAGDAAPSDASADDASTSCTPGDTRVEACGKCGHHTGHCIAVPGSTTWYFEDCTGETGQCVPGTTRPGTCGKCGTEIETCPSTCTWTPGACSGEGTCFAGAGEVSSVGCAPGDTKTRICSATCALPAWSACAPPPASGWRSMAPSPLGGRTSALAAWSGDEVLVWGGSGPPSGYLASGGAYNPATDSWRVIPDAPIVGRYGAAGVFTPRGFFVWGGYGLKSTPTDGGPPVLPEALADGAIFDPATQSWETLPPAPIAARVNPVAVWSTTTNEVILWGGSNLTDGAAYAPATRAWRTIAPSPLASRWNQSAAWDGSGLVVFGGNGSVGAATVALGDAARYAPSADAWTSIDTSGSGLGTRALAGATQMDPGRVAFLGGQNVTPIVGDGAAFDEATGTFTPLRAPTSAELPGPKRRDPYLWWSGGRLYMWGGFSGADEVTGAAYDFAGDAWVAFPPGGPSPRVAPVRVFTGTELVVWGGYETLSYFTDGKIYRP